MRSIQQILFLLLLPLAVYAERDTLALTPKTPKPFGCHDVRIGWGDMLFETVFFHDSPTNQWVHPEKLSPDYRYLSRENHRYTGHIFAEYQYYFLHWLSFGAQVDFEGILWDEVQYDRFHNPVGPVQHIHNYDLVILPTLRFTYFRNDYVRLHSGLGLGMILAMDNIPGSGCIPAPAFNLNFFTVQAGKGHWYGAVELGMLSALSGGGQIFMFGSRLFSLSVGYTL